MAGGLWLARYSFDSRKFKCLERNDPPSYNRKNPYTLKSMDIIWNGSCELNHISEK
jgi:hypothetical protein